MLCAQRIVPIFAALLCIADYPSHHTGGRVKLWATEHRFLSVPQLWRHLCLITLCCATLQIVGLGPSARCADGHRLPCRQPPPPAQLHASLGGAPSSVFPTSPPPVPSEFFQVLLTLTACVSVTKKMTKTCSSFFSARVSKFDPFLCSLFLQYLPVVSGCYSNYMYSSYYFHHLV